MVYLSDCAHILFQSADARRALPCWDEPAFKATFDVVLVVPKDRVALSNMVNSECTLRVLIERNLCSNTLNQYVVGSLNLSVNYSIICIHSAFISNSCTCVPTLTYPYPQAHSQPA